MLSYWFIGWLALVFLFLSEVISTSFTSRKPGIELLVVGVLIFLPIFRSLVTEIAKNMSFQPIFSKWKHLFFIIGIFILSIVLYKLSVQLSSSFLILFLVSTLFLGIDGRVSFLIALTFLTFCPLLLMIEYKAEAEVFAVYAYYFLVIGVVSEICSSLFAKKSPNEGTL